MFYREAGQFKTTYQADQAVFPILQDRVGLALILIGAFVLIPLVASDFFLSVVMIPLLILALASIGLNILTGYTGLLSLGTGGFMGVGAFACYKLTTLFPGVNIVIWILVSGFFSTALGILFGLPSLRKPCTQSSQLEVWVVSTRVRVGVTPSSATPFLYRLMVTWGTSGSQLCCSSSRGSS